MAEPEVVDETLILVDADGKPTDDKAVAVGGEIVQTLDDGTTRSTLFNVEPPTSR